MLPNTIQEVVERLDAIVDESIQRSSRLGYFAALYNRVTRRVRDGIQRGEFEDNERMGRLDVLFANRYIDAYERFNAQQPTTRAWQKAFEAAARDDLSVLQHLALGMNAHIDLDLGIAAEATSPGRSIASLERDFKTINQVLASLTPSVQDDVEDSSPVIAMMVALTGQAGEKIAEVGMQLARGDAWKFACDLAGAEVEQRDSLVVRRDFFVATAAEALVIAKPVSFLLSLGGDEDVPGQIRRLAHGELHLPTVPRLL